MGGKNDRLWAAVPPEGSERALTALLLHARRNLTLAANSHAGLSCRGIRCSIEAAGFQSHRTLLWMKL